MKLKSIAFCGACVCAASALAAPSVRQDSVVLSQADNNRVTITYTLENEPAVVTVDILTNGVSIGDANLTHFKGDVNRLVSTGEKTITWLPHKAWPGQDVTDVTAEVTAWSTNTPPDYMVVSLVSPKSVEYYRSAAQIPQGVANDLYKTEYMVFRKIPAGHVRWRMGTPSAERTNYAEDGAAHEVTLTSDFYMGIYEVTQRQYYLITGGWTPSAFNNATYANTRPVEQVTYEDLRGAGDAYLWPAKGHAVRTDYPLGRLRTLVGRNDFDLPLEAQWEFACRAGCGEPLYSGKAFNDTNLGELARFSKNGGMVVAGTTYTYPSAQCATNNATAAVGSYQPNAWGLYDMLGNVAELCLDWYGASFDGIDPEVGPTTAPADGKRVIRGGNFNNDKTCSRAAWRAGRVTGAQGKGGNVGIRFCCSGVAIQ